MLLELGIEELQDLAKNEAKFHEKFEEARNLLAENKTQ